MLPGSRFSRRAFLAGSAGVIGTSIMPRRGWAQGTPRTGGTLAVAGIHLSDVPGLVYERELFYERQLVSVTANTRRDGREFLDLAARIPVRVTTTPYPLARAAEALADLAHGRVRGAAVLEVAGGA